LKTTAQKSEVLSEPHALLGGRDWAPNSTGLKHKKPPSYFQHNFFVKLVSHTEEVCVLLWSNHKFFVVESEASFINMQTMTTDEEDGDLLSFCTILRNRRAKEGSASRHIVHRGASSSSLSLIKEATHISCCPKIINATMSCHKYINYKLLNIYVLPNYLASCLFEEEEEGSDGKNANKSPCDR
jgi:hypothetical protein